MNPNEIILSEEQQEFIDQALNGENILDSLYKLVLSSKFGSTVLNAIFNICSNVLVISKPHSLLWPKIW